MARRGPSERSATRHERPLGWVAAGGLVLGAPLALAPALGVGLAAIVSVGIWMFVAPTSFLAATGFLVAAVPKAGWRINEFPFPVLMIPLFGAAFVLRSRGERSGFITDSTQTALVGIAALWLAVRLVVLRNAGIPTSAQLALVGWYALPLALLVIGPRLGSVRGFTGRLWAGALEAGVLFACGFAVMQRVFGLEETAIEGVTISLGDSYENKPLLFGEGGIKTPSTYQNGNILGVITGVFFLIAVDRMLRGTARPRDYVMATATAVASFLSGSRTVVLGVFIGFVLLVLRSRVTGRTVKAVAVPALVLVVVLQVIPTFAARYSFRPTSGDITAGRAQQWSALLESSTPTELLVGSTDWLEGGRGLAEGVFGIVQQVGLVGVVLVGGVLWIATSGPSVRRWRLLLIPLFVSVCIDSAYYSFPTLFLPVARMFAPLDPSGDRANAPESKRSALPVPAGR